MRTRSSKMGARKGMLYPVVGFGTMLIIMYMGFGGSWRLGVFREQQSYSFVRRLDHRFELDGLPFYVNGWNSYWLMDHSVDLVSRARVKSILQAGSKMGLSVCRTWAFNDGSYHALQLSPGVFDEHVFQALDYVIAEARQNGIRLILSLVNNLKHYGGKTQYVQWAWNEGVGISASNDSFFYDPSIQTYFKDYIKTVLTRKNTITGIEYRDDPIIFAWELMNEPRCMSDPSGDTLHDWIKEMSSFIKSIDKKHMVTVGFEGFYGSKSPKSGQNPSVWEGSLGTDFLRDNAISTIDFASVHLYPDKWISSDNIEDKLEFARKWVLTHIEDGDKQLKKPILVTEFGLSSHAEFFDSTHRDKLIRVVYDLIYKSAKQNKSGAGAFIWQFFVKGMEDYQDDFSIVPWERKITFEQITTQSCRLALLRGSGNLTRNLQDLCVKAR